MALLRYLIPAFFILFACGELARYSVAPAANAGLLDILILILVGIWLFSINKSKYFLKNSILAFILFALLSLVFNLQKYTHIQLLISFLYLVRFTIYSSLYFVFKDIALKFKSQLPRYMFFAGFIFMIIGFIQYVLVPGLKKYYYLGWDMHQNRLFSSFIDPNFAGAFLVLTLVFTFILRDKIFPKKYIVLFYLFMALNFVAIILTYSRGAFLMLIACAIAYSFVTKLWKITAGIIISFAIIFLILSPKFGLESTNLLRFASVEARISSSEMAINIWRENPMGIGFNAYRYAREKYGDKDMQLYGPSHSGAGVENSFVFVLVTSGVFGLISYIYLLYKTLRLGFNNIKKNKYALVLFVSLVGLIVNALFINSLFYSFLMVWIFILAGVTESSVHE